MSNGDQQGAGLLGRFRPAVDAAGRRTAAWALLIGLTLFRLLLAGRFGLSNDESHYVMYARDLAWGYFDHPPMVAFLGAAGMTLGDHAFFARLGPVLLSLLAMVVLWRLVAKLYGNERLALYSLALFMLLPVHHLLGIALLPDATLNLFWCLGLFTAWQALETGRWKWWVVTGIAFGGALLSKYHGVLFPLCLFLYVVSSRETRSWLWSPKPYAAGLIGALIFLPNVIWNWQNDWISYLYQLDHGGGDGSFSVENLLECVGGQLGAGSPVLFALFVVAAFGLLRRGPRGRADRFLLSASLTVFLFFGMIGLFGKVLPHWPAVGWFAGAPLLMRAWMGAEAEGGAVAARWRRWGRRGVWTALVMLALMYAVIALPVLPPVYRATRRASLVLHRWIPSVPPMPEYQPRYDITNDLHGWDEVAAQVETLRAAMPNPERTFVFCHRFYATSQLAVYLDPDTVATSLHNRPSQYWLWFDPADYVGWDALFVDYHVRWHQGPERYRGLFEDLDDASARVEVERNGEVVHVFDVFRYYGFRGERE